MLEQFQEEFKSALRSWVGPSPEDKQNINLAGIALEYSSEDLRNGTQNFSEDRRLGSGAAGAVYKGALRGGTEVAVKVLKNNGDLAGFEDEVRVLSRFRHPNLVTLLGWGQHENDRYLVYELLPGGDVEKKLQKSKKGQEAFPWQQRLHIALDAACGLSYMLNSQPKAFHRDIKPPNILLDANGTAKMADFGLAGTIKQGGKNHLTVDHISGTPGYACPQYIESGRVSEQSEVYSFGTVLLELLMNEHPALCGPNGNIIYPLLTVVQPAAPGAHERVSSRLDPTAGWPETLVGDFINLSLSCVGHPDRRPLFETIVQELRSHVNAASRVSLPTPVRSRSDHSVGQQPQPQTPQCHPQYRSSQAQGGYGGGQQLPGPPPKPNVAVYGSMPGQAQVAAAPPPAPQRLAKPQPAANETMSEVGEIVLECVHAEGVELASIPQRQRTVTFRIEQGRSGSASIGRQHQLEFFERLLPRKDRLTAVSRVHFEFAWDPNAANGVRLLKVSGNPLLLNDRPLANNETALVQDGARIGFKSISEDLRFLELHVALHGRSATHGEGAQHAVQTPAMAVATPSPSPAGNWQASTGALLECTRAMGIDVSSLPIAERTIEIPMHGALEIGKQKQPTFFNRLLEAEPMWLSYISRAHCRLQLSRQPPTSRAANLTIENLSVNIVIVADKKLPKGSSECIQEGATLAFVAAPDGSKEVRFLEFVLREL